MRPTPARRVRGTRPCAAPRRRHISGPLPCPAWSGESSGAGGESGGGRGAPCSYPGSWCPPNSPSGRAEPSVTLPRVWSLHVSLPPPSLMTASPPQRLSVHTAILRWASFDFVMTERPGRPPPSPSAQREVPFLHVSWTPGWECSGLGAFPPFSPPALGGWRTGHPGVCAPPARFWCFSRDPGAAIFAPVSGVRPRSVGLVLLWPALSA